MKKVPKYPFDPAHLAALPLALQDLFRGLELVLLEIICSRLDLSGILNEVTVQGIRGLRSLGLPLDEIKGAIASTSNIATKMVDDLLDDVVARNQSYYTSVIDAADLTQPEVPLVSEETIESIRRQTQGSFQNITQSMGFLTGGKTPQTARPSPKLVTAPGPSGTGQQQAGKVQPAAIAAANVYQQVLDEASVAVQSGATDYNTVIAEATRDLADHGLVTVDYDSGHVDRADVAARRAIMTGVNQLNSHFREQNTEFLGTDLVEVSAHLGARNTGTGYFNHADWQGKVYRWKKLQQPGTITPGIPRSELKQSKGNYPDFETVCGYGQGGGILGWNCRHSYFPFIEGISERTYTDDELEKMKPQNRPKIHFEGKDYDDYEAEQFMRRIERELRKLKRRKAAYEASGQTDKATSTGARITALNQKYNRFSKKSGIPKQTSRTEVYKSAIVRGSAKGASPQSSNSSGKVSSKPAFSGTTSEKDQSGTEKKGLQSGENSGTIRSQSNDPGSLPSIEKPNSSEARPVNLTSDEEGAIIYYISPSSHTLNAALRGERTLTEHMQTIVHNLDSALQKFPIYSGTVHRSMTSEAMSDVKAFFESMKAGEFVKFSDYTSASTNVYDKTMDIQIHIESLTGKDIRSYNIAEQEILFERGIEFLVEKVEGSEIWIRQVLR